MIIQLRRRGCTYTRIGKAVGMSESGVPRSIERIRAGGFSEGMARRYQRAWGDSPCRVLLRLVQPSAFSLRGIRLRRLRGRFFCPASGLRRVSAVRNQSAIPHALPTQPKQLQRCDLLF
jgi:hypothetical protein